MNGATSFEYRAARADGALESGSLRADTAEGVRALLVRRGLFPLEVRAGRAVGAHQATISPADLAMGLRVLATLLASGLPLARALATLDEMAPGAWRPALPGLRAAVREGATLASALAAAPIRVPPLVVGLIQAGEAGSGLVPAVERAAQVTEEAAATRNAVRAALAYPALLAVVGTASVVLLVGYVLPRFAAILADLGQRLPPATRLVLGAAAAARTGMVPAAAAVAVALIVWRAWTATSEGRERWHTALLAVPVIGPVRHAAASGRFSAALGALLESGVSIAPALAHAARTAGDAAVEGRVLRAREAVVGGAGLAASLRTQGAVTPTAAKLIRAGEESGRLPAMLAHAARIEGEHAAARVRGAVRLAGPALILVFGGGVGLVAAALLQAVYSVRPVP